MNKKLKLTIFITFQIFLGVVIGTSVGYFNDKKSNTSIVKEPTLSEKFLSFEKDKDIEVYLDIENGCKYYKGFGLKFQNDARTPDCDMVYVEKYKEKVAKKK